MRNVPLMEKSAGDRGEAEMTTIPDQPAPGEWQYVTVCFGGQQVIVSRRLAQDVLAHRSAAVAPSDGR